MQISIKHLTFCLDKANEIADFFTSTYLGSDDPERSVDNLHDACEKYLGVKINRVELDIDKDDSAVWGMFVKHEDHYDIAIAQGLNYCWRRYVFCKELFHVVLDNEEFHNMDIRAHVEEVTAAFPGPDSRPGNPVVVEWLAEAAAMEFLFPYRRREQVLVKGKDGTNFLDIATIYRVPRVLAEKYLSGTYMAMLHPFSRHA